MTSKTTNVSELFVSFIAEGQKAATLITDAKDKAIAYAQLAQACAMSGLVSPTTTVAATKEDVINAYKESDQIAEVVAVAAPAAQQEATPAPEVVQPSEPAAAPAATEETETTEWTPFMVQKYANELDFIKQVTVKFKKPAMDQTLENFSSGQLKDTSKDITPLNIAGFVAYVQNLLGTPAQ